MTLSDEISKVQAMTVGEALNWIDGLYGRDNLPYDATDAQVIEEAVRQTREDWARYETPKEKDHREWAQAVGNAYRENQKRY